MTQTQTQVKRHSQNRDYDSDSNTGKRHSHNKEYNSTPNYKVWVSKVGDRITKLSSKVVRNLLATNTRRSNYASRRCNVVSFKRQILNDVTSRCKWGCSKMTWRFVIFSQKVISASNFAESLFLFSKHPHHFFFLKQIKAKQCE